MSARKQKKFVEGEPVIVENAILAPVYIDHERDAIVGWGLFAKGGEFWLCKVDSKGNHLWQKAPIVGDMVIAPHHWYLFFPEESDHGFSVSAFHRAYQSSDNADAYDKLVGSSKYTANFSYVHQTVAAGSMRDIVSFCLMFTSIAC